MKKGHDPLEKTKARLLLGWTAFMTVMGVVSSVCVILHFFGYNPDW